MNRSKEAGMGVKMIVAVLLVGLLLATRRRPRQLSWVARTGHQSQYEPLLVIGHRN